MAVDKKKKDLLCDLLKELSKDINNVELLDQIQILSEELKEEAKQEVITKYGQEYFDDLDSALNFAKRHLK